MPPLTHMLPRFLGFVTCSTCRRGEPSQLAPARCPECGSTLAFRRIRRWLARAVWAGSWAYLAMLVAFCTLLRTFGDMLWPATVALYSPRWIWGLPLLLMLPLAAGVRRSALGVLAAAALVLVGPLMGFCIPWRLALAPKSSAPSTIRVLTCNMFLGHVSDEALFQLLDSVKPDIVTLQEWPRTRDIGPLTRRGWIVRVDAGNHCLASHFPVASDAVLPPRNRIGNIAATRYDLEVRGEMLHVFNVHLATPRRGLEPVLRAGLRGVPALENNLADRYNESEYVSHWVSRTPGACLIAGDFNSTPDGAIFRKFWGRFQNAFGAAGFGFGYTKYTRAHGVRIDHILSGPEWRPRASWIGPDIGSDHRPLIADLERVARDD